MSVYKIHTINSQLDDLRLTQLLTRLGAESGFELVKLEVSPDSLKLVDDYGNACFDCGQWPDESAEPYETVYAAQQAARTALIEHIRAVLEKAGGM